MKRPEYKVASVFTVKYYGPTDTKGSKVKITNQDKSKYIPYDHSYNNALDMAVAYLTSKGGKVVCAGGTDKYYIIMLETAYIDEKHILKI